LTGTCIVKEVSFQGLQKNMKKITSLFLLFALFFSISSLETVRASETGVKSEKIFGKRKKNKGYQKPRSKKILGIFKRKTDCGCPKH
jgi:hypothetical protein